MERLTREMSSQQKQAIKQSLTGRSLTTTHKENISKALRNYWATIPPKSDKNDSVDSTPILTNKTKN